MALTKCRECNNEVSDKAETCPHCGIAKPAPEAKQGSTLVGCLVIMFTCFSCVVGTSQSSRKIEPTVTRAGKAGTVSRKSKVKAKIPGEVSESESDSEDVSGIEDSNSLVDASSENDFLKSDTKTESTSESLEPNEKSDSLSDFEAEQARKKKEFFRKFEIEQKRASERERARELEEKQTAKDEFESQSTVEKKQVVKLRRSTARDPFANYTGSSTQVLPAKRETESDVVEKAKEARTNSEYAGTVAHAQTAIILVKQKLTQIYSEKYPDNFSMQKILIEDQLDSYRFLQNWDTESGIPSEIFNKIMSIYAEKYPDNFSMQKTLISDQFESYRYLRSSISVKGVPEDVLNNLKRKFEQRYPYNYSMQKTLIEDQIKSYLSLHN
ncbi:MAG: hypothetical protein CVV64_13155 [Candidatus Wallbacteria bacterium HGW-Wallbacteria-1]|uniref:Zinc-ribbon domain-containing protein n=1 Tax=Candidatus Wallbacteria bacterium HGW-Wallbacteria-1 TaxID=2013854 RepID=A0A2N1PN31_9BACT|nr:MAG: hypothetical protein CVV64_13155 [Candidatus Wallbacteria bacterium HGW-Wallbacteria-1]